MRMELIIVKFLEQGLAYTKCCIRVYFIILSLNFLSGEMDIM